MREPYFAIWSWLSNLFVEYKLQRFYVDEMIVYYKFTSPEDLSFPPLNQHDLGF